ncbi:MAG: bifunctional precorrin-2 dehydrogenase/sirohydrochlorin ferrochelatase [Thermoprotei archaeon]|nr:bifunctional precorrin-2 dehydrogenase/sirohydrochlorin ferrochelatase [Thermoprotei archaeon]
MMGNFIPLYVDPSRFKVLIVGGGSVGTRRAFLFRNAGAQVTVVAKEFSGELLKAEGVKLVRLDLPGDLEALEKLIRENDIIVIAVGDERIAEIVAGKALELGKLVNNAVNHRIGNVIVPFRASVGGLEVAVTSKGATGLAARIVLDKIVKLLEEDVEVKAVYEAMSKLKKLIRESIPDPNLRMRLYKEIGEDGKFRGYVSRGDSVSAYKRGLEIIKSYGVRLNDEADQQRR